MRALEFQSFYTVQLTGNCLYILECIVTVFAINHSEHFYWVCHEVRFCFSDKWQLTDLETLQEGGMLCHSQNMKKKGLYENLKWGTSFYGFFFNVFQ